MKRLVFRIIPLLLVLTLALPALTAHAAMSRTEKENKYIIAVQALEDYLENAQEDLRLLAAIKSEFDALGGHAKSREFSAYTAILLYIAQDDFGYMSLFDMDMLARNQDFEQHLAKNYDDSPIGSVAKLRQYYDARSAEYDGDVGAAAEIYATLGSFFDAPQRYREIRMQGDREAYEAAADALAAGDFAAAYFYYLESNNYRDAKARIENIELFIGYTPENAQDNPGSVKNLKVKSVNTSSVTLTWDKAAHATRYTVEYRITGDSAWLQAGETANTSYPVNDLIPAQSYDFLVTAYSSGLKTTGAQLSSVYINGYYGTENGRWYHINSDCQGMQNAVIKTKAEWEKLGKTACPTCMSSDTYTADSAPTETWVFATANGKYFHIRSDCSGMEGAAQVTISRAVSSGKTACPTCVNTSSVYVFATNSGTLYHTISDCSGMKNAQYVTARSAINAGKKACTRCNASKLGFSSTASAETPTGYASTVKAGDIVTFGS